MIFVVNILTVMVQLLKKIYFPLEKNGQTKENWSRSKFIWCDQMAVWRTWWCEIGVLLNCKYIAWCHTGRHLLRFCISILMNRWDEFRYISFFDAMKVIKNSSKLFKTSIVLDHWVSKKKLVKKLIRLYRKNRDDPMIAIDNYKHLFEKSIKINTIIKNHIWSLVVNNNPI